MLGGTETHIGVPKEAKICLSILDTPDEGRGRHSEVLRGSQPLTGCCILAVAPDAVAFVNDHISEVAGERSGPLMLKSVICGIPLYSLRNPFLNAPLALRIWAMRGTQAL